jgi:hypothetical protein
MPSTSPPTPRDLLPKIDRLCEPFLDERAATVAELLEPRRRWPKELKAILRAYLADCGWVYEEFDPNFYRLPKRTGTRVAVQEQRAQEWNEVLAALDDKSLFLELARSDDTAIVEAVARSPKTLTDILEEIARRGNRTLSKAVASNPAAKNELLRWLLETDPLNHLRAIAVNPALTTELADELLRIDDPPSYSSPLRTELVLNLGLTIDYRTALLSEEIRMTEPGDRRISEVVAGKTTDDRLIEFLLDQAEEDEAIAEQLATNPSITLRVAERLYEFGGGYTIGGLSFNPTVREEMDYQLHGDVIAVFPDGRVVWGRCDRDLDGPGGPCWVSRRNDGDLEIALTPQPPNRDRIWVKWTFPRDESGNLRPKSWGRRSQNKRDWTAYVRAACRQLLDEFPELEAKARRDEERL